MDGFIDGDCRQADISIQYFPHFKVKSADEMRQTVLTRRGVEWLCAACYAGRLLHLS